jgi:hypothetical protein
MKKKEFQFISPVVILQNVLSGTFSCFTARPPFGQQIVQIFWPAGKLKVPEGVNQKHRN